MKNLRLLPSVVILITFTSCATLFAPNTRALAVSSQPAGADVYVNGFKMGATPIELQLTPDKSYNIEFRLEGHESVTRVVNTKVGGGWIVLDVLGGLIPIVVDAATGAWNKLDQDSVNAALVKSGGQ
ncbi:PEGA domain-containing protein [Roseivirga spongicola]|uniref:PEGA domain-containing protein n=1 Tax=Roseivirga spongicola TaxID=333140 RepID=UPI002AC9F020|nr:PEGA domain-containing protein [Roseivirga spongicola]WPZ08790.1 PEGA domain-containing protein [Roseivirga spongicola]